jgi:PST family polysaccharide transporter
MRSPHESGAETSTATSVERPSEGRLEPDEVRRRAASGAAVVGLRGLAIHLLGIGGSVVLARLLAPKDFGAAAVGITLLASLTAIVGAGLGSALIRTSEAPERRDLESVFAIQLAFSVLLSAIAAVALWPFGIVGQVTAVMLGALPIIAFRTPSELVLARNLVFRPLVAVEITESLVYYAWAVSTAALGWGVWSLATAALARAVAGSVMINVIGPVGLLWPRLAWQRTKGILGYGFRFQGFFLVVTAREQALNAGIGGLGGLGALGLWTLANRILQVPFLLFSSLNRVFFPAMSRLVETDEDPRPTIERSAALVATATGLLLVPLAGAAPALVPTVFGARWADAADVLPAACLGLIVGGPVAVAAGTYLWGVGDATTPLWAAAVQTVVWLGITLPLLPAIDMWAVGIGWCAASIVEAALLVRAASRRSQARIWQSLAVPVLLATTAGGVAYAVTANAAATLATTVVGAAIAEGLYLSLLAFVNRRLLTEMLGTTGRALRASLARAAA